MTRAAAEAASAAAVAASSAAFALRADISARSALRSTSRRHLCTASASSCVCDMAFFATRTNSLL